MKRISLALLMLLSVISFQSCKKDSPVVDSPLIIEPPLNLEQPDPNKLYLVSKITFHYASQSNRVEEYKYDALNRIIQSRKENYRTAPVGSWETFNYEYDNTNKLIKAEMVNFENKVLVTNLFTYNTNITAGDEVYFQTTNGVTAYVYPISLDANGKVKFIARRYAVKYDVKGHFSYYGAPEWMDDFDATFQFDTKKNPFNNVVGLNPNINYLVELYPVNSLNNLLTINNSGSKLITYNVNDYPLQSVYTDANGGVETVDYEYIIK
ncbi:hypothetical protein ABIB62_003420 [Mucilaginibacter sp. UYP25]|uniref:hypothetical protein n=1 Tax=unclassified Mucilaginibacter TaxID=2617802 RepID=UPI0033928B4C